VREQLFRTDVLLSRAGVGLSKNDIRKLEELGIDWILDLYFLLQEEEIREYFQEYLGISYEDMGRVMCLMEYKVSRSFIVRSSRLSFTYVMSLLPGFS